nr:retrovirus-related Pol polyprotein from transposon TNT 1-94 [Tanacetum cinerariifolium]
YHYVQGNPQQDLKDKGVIDSGYSRHMIGNRSYLTDYEEIDGGFVAFGGKFDEKADEGFFVGYSTNSKAFRVFNSRTKILEENMHVKFNDNTPNIAGSGPNWLFDIDAQTKSINYKSAIVGNRSIGSAGTKACDNVGEEEKKDAEDPRNEVSEVLSIEVPRVNQEKDENSIDVLMIEIYLIWKKLDRISDAEDDDSGVDMNNLDTYFQTLVELPNVKRAIGTKWVFKNKNDERGIVIKNKARLVAQGYTQEEGTDYDEVFALVARIKEIRLFLAYASFKDFVVYQMDVKSAFLYGKIKKEVYVCQPPGFEDPDFPNRVYKLKKTASTPMETHKTLLKDEKGEYVDEHSYRSMIGSLMYLTSSRPNIMFAVCACCKKQTVVANSTTEAEDSNEKRLIQMIKIHTDKNVTDLLTKAFDGRMFGMECKAAKDEINTSANNLNVSAVKYNQ